MDKKVKKVIEAYHEFSTPLGSYGGHADMFETPTQDADDL